MEKTLNQTYETLQRFLNSSLCSLRRLLNTNGYGRKPGRKTRSEPHKIRGVEIKHKEPQRHILSMVPPFIKVGLVRLGVLLPQDNVGNASNF